ncbi:hypothetical protein BROUX41_004725 [Berkeleyomyces rouxiae]|uniref:uncharacterized protein n=1 Tax=Berkeleyomyces rouxiae TaxID=2035830 RepID=UPI003B7B0318
MPTDDKTPICIPFILSQLSTYSPPPTLPARPIFIGLNGPQGIGKTTLVSALSQDLTANTVPHLVCSIDDFYLPRNAQAALAAAYPQNPLLQNRGEPGTHDVPLLLSVLEALEHGHPVAVPSYDKAAFSGLGDRAPEAQWIRVNPPGGQPVRVVILEGWCVGFRALTENQVAERHEDLKSKTLQKHSLDTLMQVNEFLKAYDPITEKLDAFIQISASDPMFVYEWRLEQERQLRETRGAGMTDEQVVAFVDGYFPAYELYLSHLPETALARANATDHYLQIAVAKDRSVLQHRVV